VVEVNQVRWRRIHFGPRKFEIAVAFLQLGFGLRGNRFVRVFTAGQYTQRLVDPGVNSATSLRMRDESFGEVVGNASVQSAVQAFDDVEEPDLFPN